MRQGLASKAGPFSLPVDRRAEQPKSPACDGLAHSPYLTRLTYVRTLFPCLSRPLGEAWKLGWRIRVRCLLAADNPHSRNKRITIACNTSAELDLKTLVWTRGEAFPLD